MSKDIKNCIKWLLISVFLFALGMFVMNNASFLAFIREDPMSIRIVPAILVALCVLAGFFGIIAFIFSTIVIICIEYYYKKVDKNNCKLIQEIKSELPKGTEFDVSITNQNNE